MNGPFDLKNYKNLKKIAPYVVCFKSQITGKPTVKCEIIKPEPLKNVNDNNNVNYYEDISSEESSEESSKDHILMKDEW